MGFLEQLLEQLRGTPLLEWAAVLTGVLYVIFAAKKHILCWTFALISSGIYTYLCFTALLYLETVLQLFYIAMAIVGWYNWSLDEDNRFVVRWSVRNHLLNILISGAVTFIAGYCFSIWTKQALPYMDAFTTVFSLAATFMVVQKVLENWIYWIVIDLVSAVLFYQRGFQLSSLLFVFFTVLAVFGYIAWRKQYRLQTP